jgi:hypothetical protein
MQRSIPLLAVILAVQLGLAGLLAVRRNPLAATTPQTPLVSADVENVDHMIIEGMPAAGASADSARVELAKKDGKWTLPQYFNAPADKFKLNSLLDELAGLKRGLPIATSSSALKRFKLVDGDFERRLVLSRAGKTLDTVYFGSSAGVRRTDARTDKDRAVYSVDLATYELPTQSSDWLDADLLQRDPTSVTELDVRGAASTPTFKLVRQAKAATPAAAGAAPAKTAVAPAPAAAPAPGAAPAAPASPAAPAAATTDTWSDSSLPAGQQIDSAHAGTLAQNVAELHVSAILGTQDQPQWQQQHALLTLGIKDSKHPEQIETWTVSKPASGDYYVLKSSAQPYYFQLTAAAGKQLIDASAPAQLLAASAQQGAARQGKQNEHKAARAGGKAGNHTRSSAE